MTNTWFTSDLHFRHRMVAAKRGWNDVDAHDGMLIVKWGAVVKPQDVVWVLGDVGLGRESEILAQVAKLPGRKRLVSGNHDPVWPGHRGIHRHHRLWLEHFETVQPFATINLSGHRVLLSHFPYRGDGENFREDRHTQYRLRDEGRWLIHGHTHGTERLHGRMIHVGVDAWNYEPVPVGTVQRFIEQTDGYRADGA